MSGLTHSPRLLFLAPLAGGWGGGIKGGKVLNVSNLYSAVPKTPITNV